MLEISEIGLYLDTLYVSLPLYVGIMSFLPSGREFLDSDYCFENITCSSDIALTQVNDIFIILFIILQYRCCYICNGPSISCVELLVTVCVFVLYCILVRLFLILTSIRDKTGMTG
jgi:hypothetical protein